ncbi:MAG: glutaredoxin family protein [Mariprofundus sp.]|nr:glutaredoxin family protein [Mariprofundus sp.]
MIQPHIQLLSRRDCCLCEDAKAVVAAAAEQGLCSWETINVDHDKALLVRYGLDVPVLLANGQELFRHRVSANDLQASLANLTAGATA